MIGQALPKKPIRVYCQAAMFAQDRLPVAILAQMERLQEGLCPEYHLTGQVVDILRISVPAQPRQMPHLRHKTTVVEGKCLVRSCPRYDERERMLLAARNMGKRRRPMSSGSAMSAAICALSASSSPCGNPRAPE